MKAKKSSKSAINIDHRKELLQLMHQLSTKYGSWQIFEDFLAMSAYAISNSVDWVHREKREAQYMEIVQQYEKSELDLFPQMLYHLIEELERHAERPKDILGIVFHELELHNKYKGQFFTPQHICDFMGLVALDENDPDIAKKGYISLCEPCAGSGAMILGFARAIEQNHYDFHHQMVVTATDVDIKCVWMTYLQLSLYGIPAVVIHGNSLSMEEWSRWYTPVYMLDGWIWKQTCSNEDKRYPEDEAIKRASDPMYAAIRDAESLMNTEIPEPKSTPLQEQGVTEPTVYDIALKEASSGQLTFDF